MSAQELYPTIEQDGTFGEVRIPVGRRHRYYPRAKITRPEVIRASLIEGTVLIEEELFELMPFAFKVGEKVVEVLIYIHTNFKKGPFIDRDVALQTFVKDYAPWLFSYGLRHSVPEFYIRGI